MNASAWFVYGASKRVVSGRTIGFVLGEYHATQPCVPKPDILFSETSVNVRISHPFCMFFGIIPEGIEINSF
jgi:hypothetical protein